MGYSLRDPDLLHFLEQNRKLAKVEFGPHYLVLPKDECSRSIVSFSETTTVSELCQLNTMPRPLTNGLVTKLTSWRFYVKSKAKRSVDPRQWMVFRTRPWRALH